MALKTSYSDANVVVEETLTVTYSQSIIKGSWGYTSANVSGWYNTMRELHRYARKSFRYVGMTLDAAKGCRDAMVKKFTREFKTSYWNADVMGGKWNVDEGGTVPMADVSLVHDDGDAWSVYVRVNEDDVRFLKMQDAYSYATVFAAERLRGYGTDGVGTANEQEAT